MKKELSFLIVSNLLLIISILYYTFDLLTLIIDDTSKDSIKEQDLLNYTLRDAKIPKIIHQTYKTNEIPTDWLQSQKNCQIHNPDYKYILWTDEMAENFIRENYSWFLPTFKNYKYPIQRADAIRYFILYKFGGIYIDLDDDCQKNFDSLLQFESFLRKTSPMGVSNDFMGTMPNHPFFLKLIKNLQHYNKNWIWPYFTIMGSTGPIYVSVIWKQYKRWINENLNGWQINILQPNEYNSGKDPFFQILKGSSWHLGDADFIKGLLTHILSCVVAGFVFGFVILYGEYCFYTLLIQGTIIKFLQNVKQFFINMSMRIFTFQYRRNSNSSSNSNNNSNNSSNNCGRCWDSNSANKIFHF